MIPDDPIEREALAGEYVLGVLEEAARAAVAAALPHDEELRRAVELWQERLQPLADTIPPSEPPIDLWSRIASELRRPPQNAEIVRLKPRAAKRPGLLNRVGVWRVATGVSTALAAGFATLLIGHREPPPAYVAVMSLPEARGSAFLLETHPHDGVQLTALSARAATNHSYELWAAAPGMLEPVSLGVIPKNGQLRIDSHKIQPAQGVALLVSIEPRGGSPSGLPTGPVIYQGQMVRSR